MKSLFCRRLLNTIANQIPTLAAAAPSPTTKLLFDKQKQIRSPPIKDLFNEQNLDILVKKFKQSLPSFTFRCREKIYEHTISRLAIANRFSDIEDIIDAHKNFKEISTERLPVRLIKLYGKAGMFDNARKLFDEMPELGSERTVKSFNALMASGVDSKNYDKVISIFHEIPSKLSIEPNALSYNILINAQCQMALIDDAVLTVDEMSKYGLKPDSITFYIILDAFYSKRGFEEGEKIWIELVQKNLVPDVQSYDLKLKKLVSDGRISEAIEVFNKLQIRGPKPCISIFNALIKGFVNRGNVEEVRRWYGKLLLSIDREVVPNRDTFSMLVPFFCEHGDLIAAFRLCKNMLKRKLRIDETLLQLVVDKLVAKSMLVEAENLASAARSNKYTRYRVVMALEE